MRKLIVTLALALSALFATGGSPVSAATYMGAGWTHGNLISIYCYVQPTVISRPTGTLRSYCRDAYGYVQYRRGTTNECDFYSTGGEMWKYTTGNQYIERSWAYIGHSPCH